MYSKASSHDIKSYGFYRRLSRERKRKREQIILPLLCACVDVLVKLFVCKSEKQNKYLCVCVRTV